MNIKEQLVQNSQTHYGPVFWSFDRWSENPDGTLGVVALLVNPSWVNCPLADRDDAGYGPDQIHKIRVRVPAPDGVTDEVIHNIAQVMASLSQAEREAFELTNMATV